MNHRGASDGIAVGGLGALDHVRQGSLLFKLTELLQDGPGCRSYCRAAINPRTNIKASRPQSRNQGYPAITDLMRTPLHHKIIQGPG